MHNGDWMTRDRMTWTYSERIFERKQFRRITLAKGPLGIGGLSAAVALASRGHSVLVLESTSQLLHVGAGVALPPTTRRWYELEGVLRLEDSACVPLDGIELTQWDTGDLVTRTAANPVGKQNAIHHGDLQLALLDRCRQLENIKIRLGARVTDVDIEENAVLLATGERVVGDVIVAADGIKSTLKAKVCPPEAAKAQPTGEAAYRFTLSRDLLDSDEELRKLVERSWATRWDGPSRHVVAYPVRDHQLLNVVLIHPDDGQAEESWTSVAEKSNVISDFQGWNPTLRKLIDLAPAAVPNFRMFLYPPSPVWVKGSTVLLGDACHAMLPYLGQGVAQSVEDATAIATVLSMIESQAQLPLALRAYEQSRKERVEPIQAATYKAREQLHLKDKEAQEARDRERKAASESNQNSDVVKMQHSFWVWDAAKVAQNVHVRSEYSLDDMNALKLFLDTANSLELESLALRLKPYRIQPLQVQRPDGAVSIPMLVLDGRAPTQTIGLPPSDQIPPSLCLNTNTVTPPGEAYFDFGMTSPSEIVELEPVPQGLFDFADVSDHLMDSNVLFSQNQSGLPDTILEDLNTDDITDIWSSPTYNSNPLATLPTPPQSDFDAKENNSSFDVLQFEPGMEHRNSPHSTVQVECDLSQYDEDFKPISSLVWAKNLPRRIAALSAQSGTSAASRSNSHKAALMFRCCIRKDYFDFLTTNVSAWIKDGLWMPSTSTGLHRNNSSYQFLENIYSCVSQLDTRIEYDQIRKRIALVLLHTQYLASYRDWKSQEESKRRCLMGVGRGDRTLMIDSILEQTTPNWKQLDTKKRAQLRALFHERKRYGKRWSVFQSELGPSILLLCSPQLANMVSNTKVTMAVLKGISRSIKSCDYIMSALKIMDSLAQSLIENDGYHDHEGDQILQQFKAVRARMPKAEAEEFD
ncbi:FAD-dependent oxidoreductase [Aspergillus affinis]|uniref:FAD-dependent oxidoreductase n=1 Tax=Aspergillus affinis TaxID=1070780 RepID=UPI0022FDB600|nr:FAD/NAD(P)-binding domain-containing protein [Aspergillus affinis]KAI9037687.1 FAD/NAD(P)-binding domain-containing protein [Aspergillus affinis]